MSEIDQKEAALYLLKLKKASLSFPAFMDYYHPDFEWESFQKEMQEVLDLLEKDELLSPGGNPVRNVLINMPPRHSKSFHSTINLPAYSLMRKPHRELMVSAYNNDLATTFGRGTRDIVSDTRASRLFKGFGLSKETRAVDFWKTTSGGAYYAMGLNGTTTGRGANQLYVDDPYKSREEADSTLMRRRIWDFYTSGLLSRMQPDHDGQPAFQIVTHTRWHPDDMAGRIIDSAEYKRGEWHHLNFQALTKKERGVYVSRASLPKNDPRYVPDTTVSSADGGEITGEKLAEVGARASDRSDGKVILDEGKRALWPSRFPVDWLEKQRLLLGERDFEALYQQSPYILGGNIIKQKWFRRYKKEDIPVEFHAIAIGVDTAFKAKTTSDYSVFTVAGITELGDIYILGVHRQKLEFPDLKRKAVSLNATWRGRGLRGMWVEDAASGQSLIQELRSDTGVTVLPWRPGSSDKVARLTTITPTIEAGRVFIPDDLEGFDWLEDWLAELVAFPSVKNDDQVDSFVIVVDVLSRMVVMGMKEFHAPIGELAAGTGKGTLLFGNAPLTANPKGWAGDSGFAKELEGGVWKGWGL